jgi:rod shape-determining protein MreC
MAQQPLYRRGRRTRVLVVGLVTLSLVVITTDYRGGDSGPLAAAGRATLAVISPLQRAMTNVLRPVGNFFSTIGSLGSLRSENEALREELGESRSERGTFFTLLYENERLRKLVGLRAQLGGRSVSGRVQASGVSDLEWVITIDKGSAKGVEVNDPVVGPDGLIGHVVKVTRDAADVQLILDPGSRVGAMLPESNGETGILEGQRDQDLRFTLVDPLVDIGLEDVVVTAGQEIGVTGRGSIYPRGIPIGVVSRVLEDPTALEKTVEVRPSVDFTSLDFVLVLLTD